MSSLHEFTQLLESFERYLGNPDNQQNLINWQQILMDDEQEQLPWPQIKHIQQWGFMDYLVPSHLGGTLNSLVDLFGLAKVIARRDVTLSVALGLTFFAALPVWLAGDEAQQKKLAKRIREGQISAFALTEQDHGSDLVANEFCANKIEGGWKLSGEKWCINFATFSETVTLLCRTHSKGGLLGFSLFFLDKSALGSSCSYLPKLLTHGVRGLDISGLTLENVEIPKENIIGKEQRGLEVTAKSFQISRTLLAGIALGGADAALRLAVDFSLQRHLYGKAAFAIPVVQQRLGEQFTQLLLAECTSLVVVRACSVLPRQMSLWSAIIKYLIPKISEDIVEQSAVIVGARAYLRTTEYAVLQKIRRDVQVVGLFDGSSQVNLSLIAGNLVPQAQKRGSTLEAPTLKIKELFQMDSLCKPFTRPDLSLFLHEEDLIFAHLAYLDVERINPLIHAIRSEIQRLDQTVLSLHEKKRFDPKSLAAFDLAEQYCWLFAASCCLHFWYYNQDVLTDELKSLDWVNLAIQMILKKLRAAPILDSSLQESMAKHLCHYHQKNLMFSVVPVQLAE